MTTTTSTIQGHRALSPATPMFAGAAHKLWMSLQRFGYRRAAGQLQRLAEQYRVSNPSLALQMNQTAADCRAQGAVRGALGGRT
jgi:hypothetical protein